MKIITIETFFVIGISVRTTNEKGQSGNDISVLWNTFKDNNLIEEIPNKIHDSIYCVYTDYEKDYRKPFTTIIGCKVSSLRNVPKGMIGKIIKKQTYTPFIAKGDLSQDIVFQKWVQIWNWDSALGRKYTSDFEIYEKQILDPKDVEVSILVAI